MRISLLLSREPFGEIIERTLSDFFSTLHGREFHVVWRPGRPSPRSLRHEGFTPWLCNIYLNAIFPVDVDRAVLDPIRREFSRSVRRWRGPWQRGYVGLATARWTAGWFAQAVVGVRPELPAAKETLIVAGNHKFRVLRAAAGRTYAIAKSGWSGAFLEREIVAHEMAARLDIPVPRLLEVAPNRRWFAQEYVSGTPLNRLADSRFAERTLREASQSLHRLVMETRREEPVEGYLSRLVTMLRGHCDANHLLAPEQRARLSRTIDRIAGGIEHLRSSVLTIVTAQAHGDFQPGNILVHERGFRLIDWEYSTRRQLAYDPLVFALSTRPTNRLAATFPEFWRRSTADLPAPLRDWPELRWDETSRACQLLLFLLEELSLHLEENANPCFLRLSESLMSAVEQADLVADAILR